MIQKYTKNIEKMRRPVLTEEQEEYYRLESSKRFVIKVKPEFSDYVFDFLKEIKETTYIYNMKLKNSNWINWNVTLPELRKVLEDLQEKGYILKFCNDAIL